MKIPIYHVDAFTETPFKGNAAAVCILDDWISDELMQRISGENNLSETAFVVYGSDGVNQIRFYSPQAPVELCGHATMAAAFVLFSFADDNKTEHDTCLFKTFAGVDISVRNDESELVMTLPIDAISRVDMMKELQDALGGWSIKEVYKGATDYMVIYDDEDVVKSLEPNFDLIVKTLSPHPSTRGVIVTALSKDPTIDFVSRFFAPGIGIKEDPVTGSAHTSLSPYYAKVLNKKQLIGKQISERTGVVKCHILDEKSVAISGSAVLFMEGTIHLDLI